MSRSVRMRTRLDPRALVRLMLAHHPVCHPFRHDVFRLGPLRLCVGCWTMWPVIIVSFTSFVHLGLGAWPLWFGGGLALASLQLVSAAGWTRSWPRKVGVKAVLGLGAAMAFYGLFSAPLPLWLRLVLLLACGVAAGLSMVPRAQRMVRTCEGCFFKGDWERCPGMALARPPRERSSLAGPPRHPQRL